MNPTRKALIMRDLGTVVLNEVSDLQQFLIFSGVLFWFLAVVAVARFLVRRSEWLTEEPVEIPEPLQRTWNRTATLSVAEMRDDDV